MRLGKFDADRTITFIPPDGEFELMKYRVTENINLPFKIMPAYQEQGTTRLSVTLKIAALFSPRLFATNLVIKIPVRPLLYSYLRSCYLFVTVKLTQRG